MMHYKESTETYHLPGIKEDTFNILNENMKQVRVTCYEEIKTVFYDLNDKKEIRGTESSKEAAILSGDCTELAVSHRILQQVGSDQGMCNNLAEEVINVIKDAFDEFEGGQWSIFKSTISQIVFLKPNMIEKFLDNENIQPMKSLAERENIFEGIGNPVPMDVASCLQQDPTIPVSVNKMIAYQKDNGIVVFAEVKEILDQIGTNLYKLIIN